MTPCYSMKASTEQILGFTPPSHKRAGASSITDTAGPKSILANYITTFYDKWIHFRLSRKIPEVLITI